MIGFGHIWGVDLKVAEIHTSGFALPKQYSNKHGSSLKHIISHISINSTPIWNI